MITISKELENVFSMNPLYSKDGQGKNAKVIVKFVMPMTDAFWLITEAEKRGDSWLLYGFCHITDGEFGYVSLSELMELNVHGITPEIEEIPQGMTVKQCLEEMCFAGE